jgi:Tol biopolymer transport system component
VILQTCTFEEKKVMERFILILICCLVPILTAAGQEQQAQKLLSEAVYQEEVNGELNEAIKTYRMIINQYPGIRKVSAEAYYHLGMCYEKLGRQDAMKAYREVISKYGEQKDIVAKARERLARMEQQVTEPEESEGIKIRQIWKSPYLDDLGTVSYDGRFRSFVDWDVGNVGIHNLNTGEKKKLTNDASLGDSIHFAESTAISKNGKLIAYSWWNPYNTNDLRLINVDKPSPVILYRKKGEEVYPLTWLSENEIVAKRFIPDTRTSQIFTFNILNKTMKVIKTYTRITSGGGLACSPDEKYIAYSFANDIDNGNFDINLMLANGDDDIPLIKHPANDRVLGWVPGRKDFLFLSDRSGTWDLWAITLDDAKPSGPARRIYTDIGEVSPMGFTQNGNCYFGFVRRNFFTNIAPFDAEKGEIEVGSAKSLKGSNYGVTWSPDAQYLAYIKIEDRNPDNPVQLVVRDIKTTEEQESVNDILRPWDIEWSPDGNSILVVGWEKSQLRTKGYKGGVFTVNVKTGQTDNIFLLSDYEYNIPKDDAYPLSGIKWSSDGKSFYYLFFKDRLVKHDLESGEDKILFKYPAFSGRVLDLSPDGQNLLFGLEYPGDEKSRLFTIPPEGGKEKEICTTQEDKSFSSAFWSADGKYIFFSEVKQSLATSIWRVPAEGGKPEKTWSSENMVEIFDIHPDGDKVAFSIRERATEVRVIENLLQELEKLDRIE